MLFPQLHHCGGQISHQYEMLASTLTAFMCSCTRLKRKKNLRRFNLISAWGQWRTSSFLHVILFLTWCVKNYSKRSSLGGSSGPWWLLVPPSCLHLYLMIFGSAIKDRISICTYVKKQNYNFPVTCSLQKTTIGMCQWRWKINSIIKYPRKL